MKVVEKSREDHQSRLVAFDFAFHACKQIYCVICVAADPPVVQFFYRERVDVVPAKTPFTFHDDEVCFLENTKMLHDGAAVQLPEALAKLSGGSSSNFEHVEYFAPSSIA